MFNSDAFLKANFSDPDRLIALLTAYGIAPPSRMAVAKWFQRGTISGKWLPLLLMTLELERGEAVKLSKYTGV
jgi:hypothetical protein